MREALSVFTAAPQHLHYCLGSTSCQTSGSIRFSWELKPYFELCEGSRFQAPYENHPKTMPTASVHGKKSIPQNWSLEPKMFRTADFK